MMVVVGHTLAVGVECLVDSRIRTQLDRAEQHQQQRVGLCIFQN